MYWYLSRFPFPNTEEDSRRREPELRSHTEAVSSLNITQFDRASCQKVINCLWCSYISLQSLNHVHFLILERWESSSDSPISTCSPSTRQWACLDGWLQLWANVVTVRIGRLRKRRPEKPDLEANRTIVPDLGAVEKVPSALRVHQCTITAT